VTWRGDGAESRLIYNFGCDATEPGIREALDAAPALLGVKTR
jgi:hypothetical protein